MNKVEILYYDSEQSAYTLTDFIALLEKKLDKKCIYTQKIQTDTKIEAMCYFSVKHNHQII